MLMPEVSRVSLPELGTRIWVFSLSCDLVFRVVQVSFEVYCCRTGRVLSWNGVLHIRGSVSAGSGSAARGRNRLHRVTFDQLMAPSKRLQTRVAARACPPDSNQGPKFCPLPQSARGRGIGEQPRRFCFSACSSLRNVSASFSCISSGKQLAPSPGGPGPAS